MTRGQVKASSGLENGGWKDLLIPGLILIGIIIAAAKLFHHHMTKKTSNAGGLSNSVRTSGKSLTNSPTASRSAAWTTIQQDNPHTVASNPPALYTVGTKREVTNTQVSSLSF